MDYYKTHYFDKGIEPHRLIIDADLFTEILTLKTEELLRFGVTGFAGDLKFRGAPMIQNYSRIKVRFNFE